MCKYCQILAALVAVLMAAVSCTFRSDRREKVITVKGSDTMVYLLSMWAEAYMGLHPETEISVTGGGSGTGFAALLNRTTDICAASRDLMPREQERFRASGITPVDHVVARDGIAVIVHPSNPIQVLSLEEVRQIFTGACDNWVQLGGSDRQLIVYSRDTSSGTYYFFQDHVLLRRDFRRDARLLPSTSAIVQSVAADAGAIGYVGLGYALDASSDVRCIAIKQSQQSEACRPTRDTVRSGQYAIVRPLRFFTSGMPTATVASFLDFCGSAPGQQIVVKSGFVAVE